MTPADLARENAISFECKKDALRQNQSGDWKIAFTVQGIDMDERLTKAFPGTRYVAVLVEVSDSELPVQRAAKENLNHSISAPVATLQPENPKPSAGVKREWRDMPASAQAGTRCGEAIFHAFLFEACGFDVHGKDEAAIVVRQLCRVESRREFDADPLAKTRWQALDDQYQAWKALEHA